MRAFAGKSASWIVDGMMCNMMNAIQWRRSKDASTRDSKRRNEGILALQEHLHADAASDKTKSVEGDGLVGTRNCLSDKESDGGTCCNSRRVQQGPAHWSVVPEMALSGKARPGLPL